MKKSLLPIVASALFAVSTFSSASAAGLKYFGSINLQHANATLQNRDNQGSNGSYASKDFEKNFGLGLAGGLQYDINSSFYVNAELFANYLNNNVKDITIDAGDSTIFNAKQNLSYGLLSRFGYNINNNSSVYVGLGISRGKFTIDEDSNNQLSNSTHLTSGIAALGIATQLCPTSQLYAEYQISKSETTHFQNTTKVNYNQRSFVIGLRKFFN